MTYQFSQTQRWSVDLAHAETLVDDLVEFCTSSPGQKLVQLDEEPQVWVTAFWGCSTNFPIILMHNIDSHFVCLSYKFAWLSGYKK